MKFLNSAVIKQLTSTFAVTAVGRVAQLALAILITRLHGVEGYGLFVLVLASVLMLQHPVSLGLPIASMKFIPDYLETDRLPLLRGFLRFSSMSIFATSSLAIFAIFIFDLLVNWSVLEQINLMVFFLLLVSVTTLQLKKRQLATLGRAAEGAFWEVVFPYVILIVVLGIMRNAQVNQVLYIFSLIIFCSAVLASWRFHKAIQTDLPHGAKTYDVRHWLKTSFPFLLTFSTRDLMNRVDILLLAPFVGLAQVGLYSAAFRVIYLITFSQNILISVMSPRYSGAYASKKFGQLNKDLKLSYFFTLITVIPLTILLTLFADEIVVLLFGEPFLGSAPILRILLIAQVFAALIAPLIALLNMIGYEKQVSIYNFIALIFLSLFCVWFINQAAAIGAAWARVVAFAILSILIVKLARTALLEGKNR